MRAEPALCPGRPGWWHTGACLLCDRDSVLVTWVGAPRAVYGNRHAHIYACGTCLDRIADQQRHADPQPCTVHGTGTATFPAPAATAPWLHLAATALTCISVISAAAALWLATR